MGRIKEGRSNETRSDLNLFSLSPIRIIMGIERNPRDNNDRQSDEDREGERRRDELRRENEQLRRESAQVDRELEESQRETAGLREVLRLREVEVQRLRERVAAQRARRDAANQAKSNKNQNQ